MVVTIGLVFEMIGVVAAAILVSPTVSPWLVAAPLVCYGVGLGLASAQLTGTVLADIPTEQSGQGSATQRTVRQLGAALGTALIGVVLAAGLARELPRQLATVVGLPPSVVATRDSVGGTIPARRAAGDHGGLGPIGPAVAAALSVGFAQATRTALLVAAAFLCCGILFAIRLRASGGAATATAQPAAPTP